MRVPSPHRCGPGANPAPDLINGLILLLVFVSFPPQISITLNYDGPICFLPVGIFDCALGVTCS